MSNAWARRRLVVDESEPAKREGLGVGVVQSTNLDDVFGVGHVFVIFVVFFFGTMMNGMIREKKQQQNLGHFFSTFHL